MKQTIELEALAHRLEVSGSDRTRWPAQERLRFAPLLAQSSEARQLLAEAAALDRVLDMAPGPDGARLAPLIDRIVALAEREGQGDSTKVVPFPAHRPASRAARPPINSGGWRAAALLAASLVVGAFVGTTGLLGSGVGALSPVTVADNDSDSLDATELVLVGDRSSFLEEDTL
jgi:hypothetical protein